MLQIQDRPRFARALRASWRILKLTMGPKRARPASIATGAEREPAAASQSETSPASTKSFEPETAGTINAPAFPTVYVPASYAPASCNPIPPPVGAPSCATGSPLPSEAFSILNARLDLFSQRLDLLRDQLALQRPRGRDSTAPPALVREIRSLNERVDQAERRNQRQDELASRAALRPPRVPTGLDVPEAVGSVGSVGSGTEWDFVDTTAMGPRLNGSFQDLRLATLLELLQLERRVGILVLRTGDHTLELELRRGSVVGVRLDGVVTEVVAAVREAFRWPSAEFGFRRSELPMESGVPQSIHGLLLEVLRQNDEAARTG